MMMAEQRKVLIVDDDESAREFVRAIMTAENWETVEGRTGKEAVELAKNEEPDLIILDVEMPEMNGFEAFRRLRSFEGTKDIPIIMLSAINEFEENSRHDEESMEKRFGVGRPEGFVDKPVEPEFLIQTVFGVVG